MRRFVAYSLLLFVAIVGGGSTLFAQEFKAGVDFTTLFDNTEYASMEGVASGTLFGARLTPEVGVAWQERNELMVGVDLYQDFGHDKFLSAAKLRLYYAYNAPQVKLYAGLFPRSAMRGLRSPLFFDPSYSYYNNSIGGVLARYEDEHHLSYVEFAMDYTGMRSFDTREAFNITSSGRHGLQLTMPGVLAYGYDFYMGHYAKDYNPATVDGVVDNIVLTPYVEYENGDLCRLGNTPLTLYARLN